MSSEEQASRDPLIGQDVGEYRIVGILGRGGMGVVYEAEDTALGITVALKMIDPGLARDAAFVRRFRAEARAMARIASPHIVRVMAMRQTEHGLFIVMEFVDGGTLHDRMQQGPIPWREAWPIIRQILTALQTAHGVGVIHRDVKPRNIMLTKKGVVKVTDFGLAKMVSDDPSVTVTQAVAGTLLYMSPEQVKAAANLDARSDLFALGLVIYEMLAGRLPFDRDSGEFAVMRSIVEEAFPPPTKFVPAIPAPVARAVMKALEKEPDRRYADAATMLAALEHLAEPEKVVVKSSKGLLAGLSRPVALVGSVALVVVLAAATILWVVIPGDRPEDTRPEVINSEPAYTTDNFGDDLLALDPVPDVGPTSPGGGNQNAATGPVTPEPDDRPPPPPAPGQLSVSAGSGTVISVQGNRVDDAVSLPPGSHTVRCEAGGEVAQTQVRIRSGQTSDITCHAQQPVNISASVEGGESVWLAVLVNGQNTGDTAPGRIVLGPGRHTISVQREGFEILTAEQVVTVQPSFEPLELVRLSFRVRPHS